MSPDPLLAAHAFGARNLPRLVLKPGYGPEDWLISLNGNRSCTRGIKIYFSNAIKYYSAFNVTYSFAPFVAQRLKMSSP